MTCVFVVPRVFVCRSPAVFVTGLLMLLVSVALMSVCRLLVLLMVVIRVLMKAGLQLPGERS